MQQVLQLPDFQEEAGSFLSSLSSWLLIFHLKRKLVTQLSVALLLLPSFHPLQGFKLIFPYLISQYCINCIFVVKSRAKSSHFTINPNRTHQIN